MQDDARPPRPAPPPALVGSPTSTSILPRLDLPCPSTRLRHEPHLVRVRKILPALGVAIEGGADTKQRLPRVIAVQPYGAAFQAGGVRVGHLVEEVDGVRLEGEKEEKKSQ